MIEAVVFDFDGVLVDSEPVWEQVRRQLVAELGGRWAADAQDRMMGLSTGEWARYLSEDLGTGVPADEIAALVIDRMAARYHDPVQAGPGQAGPGRSAAADAGCGRGGPGAGRTMATRPGERVAGVADRRAPGRRVPAGVLRGRRDS